MYIGITCTDDDAVVAIEQQITVETEGPGLDDEEQSEQRRAMGNCCRRHRSAMNGVFDVAMHPIDRSGEKRAQNECEQHPVFDEDIGRQYEEIETDVLVEERVVCTVGDVIEKLQDDAPIADFCRGNQQREQTCTARDNPGPWQPIAHDRQQIGRLHIARKIPREGRDRLRRLLSGKAHCKPSIQPKDDGSSGPDRKKDDGFSPDCCPKNLQITDRGKPQPVYQEVACEPEQEQANPDDDGRNDEPDHGVLPWYLRLGSGNPDRHGVIIAEMKDACRLIRDRDCASRRGRGCSRLPRRDRGTREAVSNFWGQSRAGRSLPRQASLARIKETIERERGSSRHDPNGRYMRASERQRVFLCHPCRHGFAVLFAAAAIWRATVDEDGNIVSPWRYPVEAD